MPEVNQSPIAQQDAYQFLLMHLTRAVKNPDENPLVRIFSANLLILWTAKAKEEAEKEVPVL